MKSFALLSIAALASANPLLINRAQCNADNCARAVTGTNAQPAITIRSADCSSFQMVTVTPAVVTSTVFTTYSTFVGDTPSPTATVARRQASGATTNSPTAVPTYASACSGTSRYASACSCFGITKTTSTLTASTTTTTSTVTSTVVPGPRPVCGSVIQGTGPCACTYSVTCGQMYTGGSLISTLNTISEADCVNACDHYDNCFNVDYSRTTGVCRIFQRADGSEPVDDDDAYAFAGTCQTDGSNPQCVIG